MSVLMTSFPFRRDKCLVNYSVPLSRPSHAITALCIFYNLTSRMVRVVSNDLTSEIFGRVMVDSQALAKYEQKVHTKDQITSCQNGFTANDNGIG